MLRSIIASIAVFCVAFGGAWVLIPARPPTVEITSLPSTQLPDPTPHDQFDWPVIQCGKPCVVENDPGGAIDFYAAEGRQFADDHTPIIVDGPCISACTVLVDMDRDNVCLTTRAVLGYHQWRLQKPDGTEEHGLMTYETPGLDAYLKSRGGLPTPDSGKLLMLNFAEAKQFYKACPGAA